MNTPSLSFGGLNDATTNGTSLSSSGIGAMNVSMGQPAQAPTGPTNLAGVGITDTSTVLNGGAQTGGNNNFWSSSGGAGMILGGVQVLGNLWSTYQQHKMAKEKMSFAREQWDTNLANQTQTYNTALEDRIRSRHAYSGADEGETDAYLEKHSL